jgi:predicted amidohydrolase
MECNMRRPTRSPRLATLCLQGNTAASTKDNVTRTKLLEKAVRFLLQQRAWHPIDALVLPGGFFWLSRSLGATTFERRRSLISAERFVPAITTALEQLQELSPAIRLVTGVMAQPRDKAERTEQACLAFDQTGLIGAARKMFPTQAESRGRRFMTPFADDYRSIERFVDLPNGSLAALHSCYDLFGTADHGSGGGARRAAIKALRQRSGRRLAEGQYGFRATRDSELAAWANLVAAKAPDVLLATIHAFERPGLDGYWQRHGIARASAAHGGAITIGAAHFLDSLPRDSSTLATYGVPKRELSAGVSRRAHSLAALHSAVLTVQGMTALLRVFEPPQHRWKAKNGRAS